jgi:uncharacterized protein (TIGR02453 family)
MSSSSNIFSANTISFLKELSANNNKEWFHNHQMEYEEYYKKPVRELVNKMSKRFAELQLPFHASPKFSLFRINRDIRFSKNKDPYKINIGILFPYSLDPINKKCVDKPGLYCHLEPDNSFIAGGIHTPISEDLKKIRDHISENWEILEEVINNKSFVSEFPIILNGDRLKRMPRGFNEDHPKSDWIKLKTFIVEKEVEDSIFFGDNLIDIIEKKAISIAPFLDFLYNAVNENK